MAYQLTSQTDSSLSNYGGQYFTIGRVKKIILGPYIANTTEPDVDYTGPNDIGKIRFEMMYSPLGTSKSEEVSEPAYPIFSFIKQLPVINEIVLIFTGPSERLNDGSQNQQFYYFPPYSLWNDVNHNAFPNMYEWETFLNNYSVKPEYQGTETPPPELPLGITFGEKFVRSLKPFEGDNILQSRFGQSIRFGSTVPVMKKFNTWSNSGESNDPITIIINSQGKRTALNKFDPLVEDINKDGSSIYMTSTQEIFLEDINNFPLSSFKIRINPQVQNVVEIQRPPVSNEFVSAQSQDQNTV